MNRWRPTPAESSALRIALHSIRVPDWVSRDDLEQAAMIHLWRRPPATQERAHLIRICQSAICDEMRRQMGRRYGQHAPREWDAERHDSAHHDTPEGIAQVSQAVAALGAMRPILREALEWLLTPGDLQDHAHAAGICADAAGLRVRKIREVLARAV